MRTSLSLKMLLLTLGSFLVLIAGIIISLFIYFDRFYAPRKINHIITAMNEFSTAYENNEWTDEQLYSKVSEFMKNNNVIMSITPNTKVNLVTGINSVDLSFTGSLDFFVYPYENNLTVSSKIYKTETGRINNELSGTTTNINGTIVMYPVTISLNATNEISKTRDGIKYTISSLPHTNYRQVNFSKQITLANGDVKNTSVNLSLQSVDEVMEFLISFFPYMTIAVLLLSLLMVTVYSKTITKPIISITNISNHMANMELGIKSDIKRTDELGALSASLNTLSSNLKNSLEELSAKNEQLKTDYENELQQEKARKEFVANVSHELKTPLGIIRSYSEGIRDGIKAEKRDYYIQVILDEITRMDQMLLEMLEISKFDAGVITYEKAITDIRCILDKSISAFLNKMSEKNVTLHIDGEFGTVFIDEDKIQRVLNNLVENAVKYCSSDSVISITGTRTVKAQMIRIENSCQPYTQEVLDKLWDRFYKADTSHNRDIEGTGLGLAITKSILEGHGCTYGVTNTDCGVCFYFQIEIKG